jgi:hypothetical protein
LSAKKIIAMVRPPRHCLIRTDGHCLMEWSNWTGNRVTWMRSIPYRTNSKFRQTWAKLIEICLQCHAIGPLRQSNTCISWYFVDITPYAVEKTIKHTFYAQFSVWVINLEQDGIVPAWWPGVFHLSFTTPERIISLGIKQEEFHILAFMIYRS